MSLFRFQIWIKKVEYFCSAENKIHYSIQLYYKVYVKHSLYLQQHVIDSNYRCWR